VVERTPGARRHLAWIEARGVMLQGPAGLGEGAGITRDLSSMLERATVDSTVAGVLLELDTPGGSVTDADKIHRQIGLLKAQGKKVIVLMGDVCASGGLYAAVAADRIVALPTTITGSIGVIISG
jgi:protease-4